MRGLPSTIALVVVLAGLGAYIYFVDSKREGNTVGPAGTTVESRDKVFDVEADRIEEVRLTAEDETTLLRKTDGTWKIVEPAAVDADQTEASGLTTSLTGLEVGRVVEENAADLARYGLADPRFEIAFKAQGGAAGGIHLGEKTATTTDMYAVKAGEKRVFLVPSYLETSFNKKPFDLRNKRILTVKREDVDLLEVTGASNYQLARSGTDWNLRQPVQARGDYSAVEGLVTRLETANMTKLVEQGPAGGLAPEVLAKYGLDKPQLTVAVGAGSARATLAIGTEEDGAVYARDLSRPMVFAIDPALVTDLKKPADDYRNKNLFEARPFNLARLRITRGNDTYEFEKVTQAGATPPEKWQRRINGGAAADVDTAKMDDLISKITNLRAESFVSAGPAQPELVVATSQDDGRFERVRFGRGGADTLAVRDGEPGAARVDATSYGDTVKALDEAIK